MRVINGYYLQLRLFSVKRRISFLLVQSFNKEMKHPTRSPWLLSRSVGPLFTLLLVCMPGLQGRKSKCEKITIPLCTNLGYNTTGFPNFFWARHTERGSRKNSRIHSARGGELRATVAIFPVFCVRADVLRRT